jgi:simple sugar transport system ATP-binding protein
MKALWRGTSLLILDEPTSMLTPQRVSELHRELVRVKATGTAVIFITHKLHEALAIGDRLLVLRRGRIALKIGADELREGDVENLTARVVAGMFEERPAGVSHDSPKRHASLAVGVPRQKRGAQPVCLELDAVTVRGRRGVALQELSLAVERGEVVGVAGVDGNGQAELGEVIAGERKPDGGRIRLEGKTVDGLDVAARNKLGIGYVTDDRLGQGIARKQSVSINLVLKRIGESPFWRRGRIQAREVDRHAADCVERFDIRTASIHAPISTLSGGNIQKVLLARELAFQPKIVVYNKPTYGLDVRTITLVRRLIREGTARGGAAIVISTELDELLELSDRIAVMFGGRVVGVVENDGHAGERIGDLMVGAAR